MTVVTRTTTGGTNNTIELSAQRELSRRAVQPRQAALSGVFALARQTYSAPGEARFAITRAISSAV